MARELEAKIARVLSDTNIAINLGDEAGVGIADTVVVWRTVDVQDPDTGDLLGEVRLMNLELQVYEVHPRFSLAKIPNQGMNPLAGLFKPSKVIASSDSALDRERVRLDVGDPVSVFVAERLGDYAAAEE